MVAKGKSKEEVWEELKTRFPAWYQEKGHRYNDRELDRIWAAGQKLPQKLPTTEDGLAQVFADLYGDRLRYCYHTGSWFEWDGDLWRKEETKLALHWARYICRDAADQNAGDKSAYNRLGRAVTASAVEKFARADRVFAVTATTWDQDLWLLGTPAGTVDLRTGVLREPIYADFITKSTKVPPAQNSGLSAVAAIPP